MKKIILLIIFPAFSWHFILCSFFDRSELPEMAFFGFFHCLFDLDIYYLNHVLN